jgi:hypothetical protein
MLEGIHQQQMMFNDRRWYSFDVNDIHLQQLISTQQNDIHPSGSNMIYEIMMADGTRRLSSNGDENQPLRMMIGRHNS